MNRIKELRKAKNVTQQRLADEMHVARTTVTMWEKGTKPDIDLIPQIADFFGVSTDYLLGCSDIRNSVDIIGGDAMKRTQVIGEISAGYPIPASYQMLKYAGLSREALDIARSFDSLDPRGQATVKAVIKSETNQIDSFDMDANLKVVPASAEE